MNDNEIKHAAQIIKNSGTVVFPTETVYGLGGNAFDEKAIDKIFKIKKRNYNKPISGLVNNIEMLKSVTSNISKEEYLIIKKLMPGPITLIMKKNPNIPNILTSNTDTIGIRIPANDIALKLIEYSEVPIATSSANISGKNNNIYFDEIKTELKNKVDSYINGGKPSIGIASTVVKIENGEPIILREGKISKEYIRKILLG